MILCRIFLLRERKKKIRLVLRENQVESRGTQVILDGAFKLNVRIMGLWANLQCHNLRRPSKQSLTYLAAATSVERKSPWGTLTFQRKKNSKFIAAARSQMTAGRRRKYRIAGDSSETCELRLSNQAEICFLNVRKEGKPREKPPTRLEQMSDCGCIDVKKG